MNKKFSTLVASLLLSSAFSVYAGNAKPMLATPTQVETRATSADVEEAVKVASVLPEIANNITSKVFPGFTNNSRLFVANYGYGTITRSDLFVYFDPSTTVAQPAWGSYPVASGTTPTDAPLYHWSLQNGELVDNAGHKFTANGVSSNFEVIPVISSVDADAPTYWFVLGTRDRATGELQYVNFATGSPTRFGLTNQITSAAVFCSVEAEYNANIPFAKLNDELGDGEGFNVTISSKEDEDAEIVGADVFSGKITAVDTGSPNAYQLKVGNKWIVFDTNEDRLTSDPNTLKGRFKLADSPSGTGIISSFCVSTADNGSNDIIIKVNVPSSLAPSELTSSYPASSSFTYRLYVSNTAGTYGLGIAYIYSSAPEMNVIDWAAVAIGDNNIVDLREFLTGQFYTIDFVESESTTDEYKDGGRLAIRENGTTDYADYVDASSLFTSAPEAQWAVSSGIDAAGNPYFDGTITLKNRENPAVTVTIPQLRRGEKGLKVEGTVTYSTTIPTGASIAAGDIVKITAVANHDKHDGYEVISDNDLRNETYRLGQLRQTADGDVNVYWAENHDASHQIGATVDETKATRWNLSLVKKANAGNDYVGQTDSILVVSELQEWVAAKSRIETKKDTLVILPYAFQNRSNSEFAEFNDGTNLNYYQCNVYDQNEQKVYKYGTDAMFALKRKADVNGQRVYNYVMLNAKSAADYTKGAVNATTTAYATYKVYQENSTDRGTWKNMQMYANDANSLMFVEKAAAPEYRKLVTTANLDTVKLYRADNEAQVVYEKRDAKAVVEGRTLSFLNIDNVEQFKDINPALYADTAYVNRGNNTRYQYLLGVNIEHTEGFYCPIHGFTEADDCGHAVPVSYNKGRYLINMIDTANVYGKTAGIHNNPYINETEEGRTLSKLSFVDAIHVLTDGVKPEQADKLYVINNGDTTEVALGTESLNTVKFAFKYIDSMESSDFKIQTLYKPYDPATYGTNSYAKGTDAITEEGYLRWVNGCLVVDSDYTKGDVFNMDENETRTPTANEEISAESASVVVAGTNGAVVVKGAEGKNVIVSTILGKVVANEVVSSDNATIAAPAGVVVVSVDGESFKVVVK